MEKTKRFICFREFLNMMDFSAVSLSFRYKSDKEFSTYFAGIIFLLFFIISIAYFIIHLIPFFKKEDFTLQYYTMNLDSTEDIKLKESKLAFAVGLTCPDEITTKRIRELFDFSLEFLEQTKVDRYKQTNIYNISAHQCTPGDFYNLHDKSFELLNIKDLQCIDQKEFIDNKLQGIYTDDFFTYYRFTVSSKYNNENFYNTINDFLLENDCKLQFYYTDITVDLSNYKNPIKSYINSLFLQLHPTLIQEKNAFFLNYHLINDSKLFHFFPEDEIPRIITGFSRVEDYSMYKGLIRNSSIKDNQKYAKLYVRVDNRKIVIKRNYPDFMVFFADTSAFLMCIYEVLCFVLGFYAYFKANHSISKKLFFYEGIKNNKIKELKKVKNIIGLENVKEFTLEKKKQKELIDKDKRDKNTSSMSYKNIITDFFQKDTESKFNDIENDEEKNLINYSSYYIYDMIISKLFCCCETKKFKAKESLIKQSHEILDEKLDIFLYLRNVFLFEMINNIYLENKSIIDLLSRPIIHLNKFENKDKENNEKSEKFEEEQFDENDFYKFSNELDFNNLNKRIKNLAEKSEKTKNENKIIFFLKQKLKELK